MKHPREILAHYWGFSGFKDKQEEIIEAILQGKDTIALLPTGGGKSVCFQIPSLAMEGICIVISPLIALMNDQVNTLKEKGIKALAITGGISQDDLTAALDNALFGNYKFLYLSPERLQMEQVQNAIRKMQVNLIAIDEAHCISQWGNDFRPAYLNLNILKELQPYATTIALTGSATPEVLEDTITALHLHEPVIFKKSFFRPEIIYEAFEETDKAYRLIQLLKNNKENAIVYVRSRNQAETFANKLNQAGIESTFFHGGLSTKEKKKRLAAWKLGATSTMIATNAFGMGIDQANVRFVIHIQLPESIESYYQEAGRAGRDGKNSRAIILFNENDKALLKRQFIDTLPTAIDLKKLYRTLSNYFQISYGEGLFTSHNFNFSEFCDIYNLNPIITYNALQSLERLGILQLSKQFGRKSKIQFVVSSKQLLDYFDRNTQFSLVGKSIVRIYGGIFDVPITIDLDRVAYKNGISIEKVTYTLQEMQKAQVIDLTLHDTDASITFLVPREDDRVINPFTKTITIYNENKKRQVEAVLRFIENTKDCKSLQLLQYFGEENLEDCGICSVCVQHKKGKAKGTVEMISEKIMTLLQETPMDSRTLSENLTFTDQEILKTLQWLLDRNKIKINAINQYYIK